ncbi:MAG: MBG domain-containing protein, partial [Erysipelotrichaceae bacterium]|nr:MBG domain-containing protein [Erysipelotrichaceae bacterium]
VTADNKTKTYGADDPTLTYISSGILTSDYSHITDLLTISREKGEDVGTYKIEVSPIEASKEDVTYNNYDFAFVPGEFKIFAKDIYVVWGDEFEFTYSAKEQTPSVYVDGIVDGDESVVDISHYTFDAKKALTVKVSNPIDAGQYWTTVSLVGDKASNYNLLGISTHTFSILQKELHLIWSPKVKFTRHSYAQAPYIMDVEGLEGDDTYGMQGIDDNILDQDVWIMYVDGFGPQIHTGKYIAKVELVGPKAKNYKIKEGDEQIAFKIHRKPNEDTNPVKTGVE